MMSIDDLIDRVIEECDGDVHGALKALLLLNERLEAELHDLREAANVRSPDAIADLCGPPVRY